MVDIAVVDYGMGNLRSVQQAVRKVAPDADIVVTGDAGVIAVSRTGDFPRAGCGCPTACAKFVLAVSISVIAGCGQ